MVRPSERESKGILYTSTMPVASTTNDRFVCKISLLAGHIRPKVRPSAARDDRVSCIQTIDVYQSLYTRLSSNQMHFATARNIGRWLGQVDCRCRIIIVLKIRTSGIFARMYLRQFYVFSLINFMINNNNTSKYKKQSANET